MFKSTITVPAVNWDNHSQGRRTRIFFSSVDVEIDAIKLNGNNVRLRRTYMRHTNRSSAVCREFIQIIRVY